MDTEGRELSAADLWALFDREYRLERVALGMVRLEEVDGGCLRVQAQATLEGQALLLHGEGNGPVDAFVAALRAHTGTDVQVLDYHEHALGAGAQARAAAYIELRVGAQVLFGAGIDANIVNASLKALLSGLARAGVAAGPAAVQEQAA
jgi:2-isopropylmalate synthase